MRYTLQHLFNENEQKSKLQHVQNFIPGQIHPNKMSNKHLNIMKCII